MIEFTGQLNENAKKFLISIYMKGMIKVAIILYAILGIPTIIFALTVDRIAYAFIIVVLLSPILFTIPIFTKSTQNELFPYRAFIDREEGTVIIQPVTGEKYERFSMIQEVKIVNEYGDWYHMIIPKQDKYFIFQKDLITQGTIEEFESIFEDKIVRINK